MNCSSCGHFLPEGSMFCPECGAPCRTEKKKRKPYWIIPLVLALLIGGCAAWLLLRKPAEPDRTDPTGGSLQSGQPGQEPGDQSAPETERPGPVTVFDCGASEEELRFVPELQQRGPDGLVEVPPYPVRDGYVFGGWYRDEACTQPFDFAEPQTGDLTLHARWIDETSEEAQLTEEEWNVFLAASEEFNRRTAEWFDENGCVAPENREHVLDLAEAYAAELKQNGTATYYSRDENTVYVEFASMIPYIFYPFTQGFDGSGEGVIVAVDPLANEVFKDSGSKRGEFCKEIAEEICETMRITESNHYSNGGADYIELQGIPNCEVFLWHGHGIYLNELHSVLVTGDTYTDWEYAKLYFKLNMSEAGNIRGKTFCGITGNRIGVTGDFFRLNTDFSMAHGLAYLAACHSLDDNYLLNTFTGAEVVFGNEESIYTSYDQDMMRLILRYMCGKGGLITDGRLTSEIDPVVYTAEKALEKAHEYQRSLLKLHGAEYDGHDYIIKEKLAEDQWVIESGNATVKCFGYTKSEYTLVPGIKGSLTTPDGSFSPDAVQIMLSNGQTGKIQAHVKDEFGNPMFYVDNVEPGTYSVEIRYFDVPLWSKENVEVVRHRYTDLGIVELPLCTVTGLVLDADTREPVASDFTGTPFLPADASNDEDGRFEIVFPKGSWVLQVNPFDHVGTSVSFEVPEGKDVLDLGDILVHKEALPLSGPVVSDGAGYYYWKYSADSHEDGYLFAEFPAVVGVENQLICWKDGRETELLSAAGEGTLCLAGGRIWFERVDDDRNKPRTVCSVAMDGSDYRSLQKGQIRGVSSDGRYLLIQQYDLNQSKTYEVRTGAWTTLPEGSNAILTVHKDRIYYYRTNKSGDLTMLSVNFDGTENKELITVTKASMPGSEYWMGSGCPGEVRFPEYQGAEYIVFTVGNIAGSGGTFNPSGFGLARIGGTPMYDLNIEFPEATSPDFTFDVNMFLPTCCENRFETYYYSPVHWWYTQNSRVWLVDPGNGTGEEVVSSDELPAFFEGTGALGTVRGDRFWRVVEVQKLGDQLFFRAEQSRRDEKYDLGWREGYAFEKGALFVKDLKTGKVEILYTYGGTVDVKIERKNIYYESEKTGYRIPMHYDLVTVLGDDEATRRINEAILEDFHQFRVAGNEGTVDPEHINRERHGWMYVDLNSDYASDFIESPGIFPATVTAEVTCNRDGLLSIRYDAHYWYDYSGAYGMTFDVHTGELLTIPEICPGREEQIRSVIRSKSWIPAGGADSAMERWMLNELEEKPLSQIDFYIDGRELILLAPRLQFPDGAVLTYQIPCGTLK